MQGKVYLIGAGPGDPGLMTLKGKDILCHADVIIYDYLANKAFLEYAKPQAELIYVGKKGGDHTMAQEQINQLIVEKSKAGKDVARLKGGDPFIFGRGGEEAQELVADGVPFEVVPGITSAISVPAYAGIPLTHRDYTATVAFVTGHEDPLKDESNIQWDKLATGVGNPCVSHGRGQPGKNRPKPDTSRQEPGYARSGHPQGYVGRAADPFRQPEKHFETGGTSRVTATGDHHCGGCGAVAG